MTRDEAVAYLLPLMADIRQHDTEVYVLVRELIEEHGLSIVDQIAYQIGNIDEKLEDQFILWTMDVVVAAGEFYE